MEFDMINGFFDIQDRLDCLSKNGDMLPKLKTHVPWNDFRRDLEAIHKKDRKSNAGRKPFDVVLMFKIVILQSLYNLSDDVMEYQIMDRLSFMRFLDLDLDSRIPDAKTIWLFRDRLEKHELVKPLFEKFDAYLRKCGFEAKKGQIIDATIVKVPIQRNSREENEQIKKDEPPVKNWSKAKRRQKDTDARWTKKNNKSFFGFKNHIQVDVKHKFVRDYVVTDASVHDSQVFEEILDEDNSSCDVYADSAYRSKETEDKLKKEGFRPHLQRKGNKGHKLTEWEKQGNRTRSKTRSRVEHVFGVQAQKCGNVILRTIGITRAEVKLGLRNLAYNMDRFCTLKQAIT
jgi:IS5 family transposase